MILNNKELSITKIDEDIYIFKDIISKEDAEKILNVCTNLQQGQWNLPWSGNTGDYNWIWSNRFATTETLESINSNISHEWKEIMNNVKKTIFNFLKKEFSLDVIKASGLDKIVDYCFTYPFIVGKGIKYFRINIEKDG